MRKTTSPILNIWICTAIIIAGVFAMVFASQRVIVRNTAEAFNRQQQFLVREAARGIQQHIANIQQKLLVTADTYVRFGDPATLKVLFDHHPQVMRAVFVAGADGALRFWYPGDGPGSAEWLSRLKSGLGRSTPGGLYSEVIPQGIGGEKNLSFVLGVPLSGTSYRLCCVANFDTIKKEYIYPVRTGATGYAWMIDSTGMLLAHPNAAMEGRKALDVLRELWPAYSDYNLELIINREMTRGEDGKGEYTGWHIGEKKLTKKLIAFGPIRAGDILWSIGISAPYREVMAPLMQSIAGPLVFLACFVISILGGAWLLTAMQKKKALADRELQWSQEVFDGITDGISIIDRDYRVLMVNRAVSLWQGQPQEVFKGKRCHEVFQQQAGLCPGCPAREAFETGRPVLRERVSTTLAGKKYYFHLSAFPLKNEAGETVRVAECVRDVTREMHLRQELLQHERTAVIVKMAAQVAHEIRNPLASLTLNIDLLEDEISGYDGVNAGEATSLIATVKAEIEGLNRVLQEYLECTRFPTIRPDKQSLRSIIESLIALLEEDLRRKKIVFKTTFAYDIPLVLVDQDHIRRAFLNIIQNAVDAMPGGGTLEVQAGSAGAWVEIVFADTGPGIAPEQVEKVFSPFYTTKRGGTGLGLSITQHIVSEHKGEIVCESNPAGGTRFIVRLPVWTDEETIREV